MNPCLTLMVVAALIPGQELSATFEQDFRGNKPLPEGLAEFGPAAFFATTPGPDGLQITMIDDPKALSPGGFRTTFAIKGDFEIDVGYELLRTEMPTEGSGVGLEVYMVSDTPSQEALALYRLVRPAEGEVLMCSRMTGAPPNRRSAHERFPATSKSGRLRLTRQGADVIFSAAEGDEADFKELHRMPFGTDDVKSLRVGAFQGRTPNAVDLRISTFGVRAQELPGAPDLAAPPVAEDNWKLWAAVALVVFLVVGLWLGVRGRRRRDAVPAAAAQNDEVEASETATLPATFSCAHCARSLKLRPELAGKKVKCPHCGRPTPVPEPDHDASSPPG